MGRLRLYWHTVRYLRAEQIVGRIRARFQSRHVDMSPVPPPRMGSRGPWVRPAAREASLVDRATFRFLNEVHALSDVGWDNPGVSRLWRYNLHYFDDLNAANSEARAEWHHELMTRWMRDNPPGRGTGWEPYPASLRIVNWIKWAMGGGRLPEGAVESLALQARCVAARLEVHLLGNHLFANAKALVFAGVFFDGPEAAAWLRTGLDLLAREVPEQILSDGGHFERTTMYHALALEDMLDLVNLASAAPAVIADERDGATPSWRARVPSMRSWLAAMCHPDGEISFFNDSAIGIAPRPAELERYASDLGLATMRPALDEVTHLGASGYVRIERGGIVALLDVAPIGPDYLPGHAHADTLSFELSIGGQRVIVNSGISQYALGPERQRERGTAAHNTVVVDGQDSSEVWGSFRVARRARPFGLELSHQRPVVVRCSHDGYRRLPGRPVHTRTWRFEERAMVIEDQVSGTFARADARFHLHPDVVVTASGESWVELKSGGGITVRLTAQGSILRCERDAWHPQFGRSEPTTCVVAEFTSSTISTRIEWTGAA